MCGRYLITEEYIRKAEEVPIMIEEKILHNGSTYKYLNTVSLSQNGFGLLL